MNEKKEGRKERWETTKRMRGEKAQKMMK